MKSLKILILLPLFAMGCIGDDIVLDEIPERVSITNSVDSLQVGNTFQFEATFLNNVGIAEAKIIEWFSSNENIVTIESDGTATGITEGNSQIYAQTFGVNGDLIADTANLFITEEVVIAPPQNNNSRSGTIETTSSYVLEGSFTLRETDNGLVLELKDDYEASSSLPGLYVYLTNNPNTLNGALELGKTQVFSGAHSYEVPASVELNTYNYVLYFCKPFGVKVGDGEIED